MGRSEDFKQSLTDSLGYMAFSGKNIVKLELIC